MTKNELIAKIAEEGQMTKKAASETLDVVANVIVAALQEGEIVKIPNVGTFSVKDVAERTGIIQMGDRKGETYVTPAHKAPKFKVSKALADALK